MSMQTIGSNNIGGDDSPLRGDQNGNLRLLVVGNSGTGKAGIFYGGGYIGESSLYPGRTLGSTFLEAKLDEDEQFREEVASFISQNDKWVIDGDFTRLVGDLTKSNATDIIWLDPPFALYYPRLILRTFFRLLRLNDPCSPGCNERWSNIFTRGKASILWWCWNNHNPQRVYCTGAMKKAESNGETKWIRLGGWGGDLRNWLDRVKKLAKSQ